MTTVAKYRPKNGTIDVFDQIFNDDLFGFDLRPTTMSTPTYDIIENENEYIVDLMLAGFKKENVSISVDNNVLTIEGERKAQEKTKYNCKGSFYGQFKKSFTLPENVFSDKIDASFSNGILSISIPKDTKSKLSKTIEIK